MRTVILFIVAYVILFINISAGTEQRFLPANYAFIENKGQIKYTDGKPAKDILYMYQGNGIKIYIKRNSICYELYTIEDGKKENSRQQTADGRQDKRKQVELFAGINDGDFEPERVNSHRVDIEFENSNLSPEVIAENMCEEYCNFYNSDNEEILFVKKYKKITIKELYPGIDLVYYFADSKSGNKSGKSFKYDLVVKPGADYKKIKLLYRGASSMTVAENGSIILETSQGKIIENIPLTYYRNEELGITNGQLVKCDYKLLQINKTNLRDIKTDNGKPITENVYQLSFSIQDKKSEGTLVIDPELFWGTYFGGDEYDYFCNVAVDSRDNIYAVGYTQSTSQIATSGAHQTTYTGNRDAVLAKFNNQGRMVWATYYGGSEVDYGYSVLVNHLDFAFIAGTTSSLSGIATSGSYQDSFGGGVTDGFLAKFNSSGVRQWGTYYGGEEVDYIYSMSMDSSRNFIIGGKTQSMTGIATSNGMQNYKEQSVDGFIVKFDTSMNRVWGTYFGGPEPSGQEAVTAICADRAGNIMVTGFTPCSYSIANDKGFQTDFGGGDYDAFIIKLYPSGQMHWGSYYGGSGDDFGRYISTYGNGNIYFTGTTKSYNNISSNNGFQQTFGGGDYDAFLVKLDTYGDRKWGTYYGGSNDDYGVAVTRYGLDGVVMLGNTFSTNGIATNDGVQTLNGGKGDIFAVRFNGNGERKWGTFYGDTSTEKFDYGGVCFDNKGNLVIAGSTESIKGISTPSTNPHQPDFAGGELWGQNPTTGEMVLYGYRSDGFLIMLGTRITINNLGQQYCQGDEITVQFTVGLDFNTNNTFTLQLSDSNGNFSNPVNIGTLNAFTSDYLHGIIPLNTPAGNRYRVRITASSPANTSDNNGFNITVNPLPKPDISGQTPVCSRNTYTYQVNSQGGYENKWTVTNGEIIGDSMSSAINVKWKDFPQGKLKVVQTVTTTGCVDSTEETIQIVFSPQPLITGETSVASYSTENYSTTSQSILDYEWLVAGGTIEGTSNTNRISVKWGGPGVGSVRLKLTDTRTDCEDTLLLFVTINSSPLIIQGKKKVCAFSIEKYAIVTAPTAKNRWTVIGGQISGNDKDSVLNILWGNAGEGFVQLIQTDTVSNEMDTVVLKVEIIPAPDVVFTGINEICEGYSTAYIAVNTENRTNKWVVYYGDIIGSDTGDSVYVIWGDIPSDEDSIFVKGSVSLTQTDLTTGCSNTKTMSASISKNPTAEFTGNTKVCSGRVEAYFIKDKNIISNKWTVTGGTVIGTAEDTTIQIEWGQPGTGKIKLFQVGSSTCYDSTETVIFINPVPEKPTITQSGTILYSSSEEGNQWFYNGEKIEGAEDRFLMPDKTGYFTVQVTNQYDCGSDMSQPYYFEISRVINLPLSDFGIRIYPNPAGDEINIDLSESLLLCSKIKLINPLGVAFFNNDILSEKSIKIDLSAFPSGIYILELQAGSKVFYGKIIKD